MPLFKSNNQHANNQQEYNSTLPTDGNRAPGILQDGAYGADYSNRTAPATSGPGGFGQDDYQFQPQRGHNLGHTGNHGGQQYPNQGQGNPSIPPAQVLSHGGGQGNGQTTGITGSGGSNGGGSGQRFVGKVETAVGSAIGSQSLKAKGLEKQRESDAFKLQAAELTEAERLEGQARIRRERAVAHGAHPDNMQASVGAGGMQPTTGNFSQGRVL